MVEEVLFTMEVTFCCAISVNPMHVRWLDAYGSLVIFPMKTMFRTRHISQSLRKVRPCVI